MVKSHRCRSHRCGRSCKTCGSSWRTKPEKSQGAMPSSSGKAGILSGQRSFNINRLNSAARRCNVHPYEADDHLHLPVCSSPCPTFSAYSRRSVGLVVQRHRNDKQGLRRSPQIANMSRTRGTREARLAILEACSEQYAGVYAAC